MKYRTILGPMIVTPTSAEKCCYDVVAYCIHCQSFFSSDIEWVVSHENVCKGLNSAHHFCGFGCSFKSNNSYDVKIHREKDECNTFVTHMKIAPMKVPDLTEFYNMNYDFLDNSTK